MTTKEGLAFLILSFMVVLGITFIIFNSFNNIIEFCEDNNWDGSTYYYEGISLLESDDFQAKCNKAKETDAMTEIVRAFPFVGSKR